MLSSTATPLKSYPIVYDDKNNLMKLDKDTLRQMIIANNQNISTRETGLPELISMKETDISGGYLSTITRVELEWEQQSADGLLPKSVVVKSGNPHMLLHEVQYSKASEDNQQAKSTADRLTANLEFHHNVECNFFKFIKSVGGTQWAQVKEYTPHTYIEQLYAPGQTGFFVMQDVGSLGKTSSQDLSYDQVCSCIEFLAALHLACWQNLAIWQQANFVSSKQLYDNNILINDDVIYALYDAFADEWPSLSKQDIIDLKALQSIYDWESQNNNTDRSVIVHGDFWSRNILYSKIDSNQKISNASELGSKIGIILDYQFTHQGSCMEDLAHLLNSSCSNSMRQEKGIEFLKIYYDKLQKGVEDLEKFSGNKVVIPYSFEEIIELYHRYQPFGIYFYLSKMDIEKIKVMDGRSKMEMLLKYEIAIKDALKY